MSRVRHWWIKHDTKPIYINLCDEGTTGDGHTIDNLSPHKEPINCDKCKDEYPLYVLEHLDI